MNRSPHRQRGATGVVIAIFVVGIVGASMGLLTLIATVYAERRGFGDEPTAAWPVVWMLALVGGVLLMALAAILDRLDRIARL